MDANPERVDRIRRTRSEVENHVIDELFAGRITRRDFVRRMTVLGMSASLAGFLAACSSDNGGGGTSPSATGASGATGAVVPGGTLKTGIIAPASGRWTRSSSTTREVSPSSDSPASTSHGPTTSSNWSRASRRAGRRTATARSGRSRSGRGSRSRTARRSPPTTWWRRWSSMRIRRTSRTRSPRSRGCSRPAARRPIDDATVEFTLDAANGNFPYLVSSDNYNVDHPAQDVFRGLGQDVHGNRSVEDADLHAGRRRHVRQEPRLLGHRRASRTPTRTRSRSTRRTRRRSWASRAAR